MDLENGYSSAFTMIDSKVMRSSRLAGAHFRFGAPDPSEGFPSGTTFSSPLLVANVSDKPAVAHISVDYTVAEKLGMTPIDAKQGDTQDKFSNVAVKDVTIAPGAIERIELADELARLGVPTPVLEAGVEIIHEAPPGSLIGHLVSADQTGDYSFEIPIKDSRAWNAGVEGIYPWTLENGTRTVLHLKNTTDQPVSAWSTISFPGGTYHFPLLSFDPYQTIAIDIQALKDSKKPDALGKSFPIEATHGQIVWFPRKPYSLVGRAEQTNLSEGIARSFSCQTPCCTNFYERACTSTAGCGPNWSGNPPTSPPIAVSGLTGRVGDSGQLTAYMYGVDCNGNSTGPAADSTAYSWSPRTTGVVSISGSGSTGNVSYIGAGTTNVSATINNAIVWYWNASCQCTQSQPNNIVTTAFSTYSNNEQAPVNVIQLDITGNSFIFVGTDPNEVTANSFFATVSPSGGTLTGTSSDTYDRFTNVPSGGPGLYVTTTDQSASNSDRTLTFTYSVNGEGSVSKAVNVTSRLFSYATDNYPSSSVCLLGYGWRYNVLYTIYTHPDEAAVQPGLGLTGTTVAETWNPSPPTCGQDTGPGGLDSNSQFTDVLADCSSSPLPTCTTTVDQYLAVAGYRVRHNGLTMSDSGLTFTSYGPSN